MKTPRCLLVLLTVLFALLLPRVGAAREEVSFDFFYDSLAPYGEWVEVGDYGYCWRPTDVDRDWAPYADGYWAFTDAGWTWVSYEEFGGIVYHYGRWVRTEDAGWCWVPDYEWGPAWVSWRNNDDYVGWAPLPPEARWQPSVGLSVWVDRVYDIGPGSYNFCRSRDFGAPVLRPVIVNRTENVTIIRRTVNVTNITYNTSYGNGPVIYNGGPKYNVINERSNRRVPSLKLVQNIDVNLPGSRGWDRDRDQGDRDGRRRNFNAQAVGNQLIVTAPGVQPPVDPGFLKSKVQRVIAADKVTRGWGGVKNDEVRRELKQEMQRQTKGLTPETTPARGVVAADLKVLPEKADPQATSPVATREKRDWRDKGDAQRPVEAEQQRSQRERGEVTESARRAQTQPWVTKAPQQTPAPPWATPSSGRNPRSSSDAQPVQRPPTQPWVAKAPQQTPPPPWANQSSGRNPRSSAEAQPVQRPPTQPWVAKAPQQTPPPPWANQSSGRNPRSSSEAQPVQRPPTQPWVNKAPQQTPVPPWATQSSGRNPRSSAEAQPVQRPPTQPWVNQPAQRAATPQPWATKPSTNAPPSATPTDGEKDWRGKKKDKDN